MIVLLRKLGLRCARHVAFPDELDFIGEIGVGVRVNLIEHEATPGIKTTGGDVVVLGLDDDLAAALELGPCERSLDERFAEALFLEPRFDAKVPDGGEVLSSKEHLNARSFAGDSAATDAFALLQCDEDAPVR